MRANDNTRVNLLIARRSLLVLNVNNYNSIMFFVFTIDDDLLHNSNIDGGFIGYLSCLLCKSEMARDDEIPHSWRTPPEDPTHGTSRFPLRQHSLLLQLPLHQ